MQSPFNKECVEKWKIVELQETLYKFGQQFEEAINKNEITNDESYEMILVNVCAKSIVTFKEIIFLCALGFDSGPFELARNLYEQVIILMFFENNRNSADFSKYIKNYYKNIELSRLMLSKFDYECHDIEDKVEEIERKVKDIKEKNKIKNHDYWWADCNNFNDLREKTIKHFGSDMKFQKFCNRLHIYYKLASSMLHASGFGNIARLGRDYGGSVIDVGVSDQGQQWALYLATISFIGISGVFCNFFKIDLKHLNKEFNDLSLFYHTNL